MCSVGARKNYKVFSFLLPLSIFIDTSLLGRANKYPIPSSEPPPHQDIPTNDGTTPSIAVTPFNRAKSALGVIAEMYASVAVALSNESNGNLPLALEVFVALGNCSTQTWFPLSWYNNIHIVIFGRTLPKPKCKKHHTGLYFIVYYIRVVVWFLLIANSQTSSKPGQAVLSGTDKCYTTFMIYSLTKTLAPQLEMALDAIIWWSHIVCNRSGSTRMACCSEREDNHIDDIMKSRWEGNRCAIYIYIYIYIIIIIINMLILFRFWPVTKHNYTEEISYLLHILTLVFVTYIAPGIFNLNCTHQVTPREYWMDVWVWTPLFFLTILVSAWLGIFLGTVLVNTTTESASKKDSMKESLLPSECE
jgi:hypothetical protein